MGQHGCVRDSNNGGSSWAYDSSGAAPLRVAFNALYWESKW
ncbi:hypothetical protein ACWD0A_01005 [Streptomyces sp. NPDC002867]